MSDLLQLEQQIQLSDAITAMATSVDCWAASSAAGEVVGGHNQQLIYYQTASQFSIDCLAYSHDGEYLAAAGQAGGIQIWYQDTPWQTIPPTRAWIDRLAWHPQLPILAVAVGKQVQLWQVATQKLLVTLPFDRSSIFDLSWHPDGNYLAVAGYGGVAVWQWNEWQQYELLTVETSAHRLACSGEFVAVGTIDRQLVIAANQKLEQPWIIRDLPGKISQLQWLTGEPVLAIISDGELICWRYDAESWQPIAGTQTIGLAAHPQLSILAAIDLNGVISIQDQDLTILAKAEDATSNQSLNRAILKWGLSGDRLLIGNNSGQLNCWLIEM
jgi:WD40 repeat protein